MFVKENPNRKKKKYVNLACFIIIYWSDGNIYSPVRYSYALTLLDDNTYIFAASLLTSYCNFSFLIFSSIFKISFYIPSRRFVLKYEDLSDARVLSIAKKKFGFTVHFLSRFIKPWKSISDEWLSGNC